MASAAFRAVSACAVLALLLALSSAEAGKLQDAAKESGVDLVHVVTSSGEVIGIDHGTRHVFLGVPFAQPPVGPLRFRPPLEVEPWEEPLMATETPNACVQVNEKFDGVKNGEDCLYMNIHVPAGAERALPVMVWLHGGGFITGTSSSYDPQFMMEKARTNPVIVVTVNYRLAQFGFLALEEMGDDVNVGLLDQRRALQWVSENIAAFGGDPLRITLFGESAGASSTAAHMAMRGSWPYFHRAILESTAWDLFPLEKSINISERWAARVGCFKGRGELLPCLQSKPLEDVMVAPFPQLWPATGYAEMPQALTTLWESGAVNDVPVIMGINEDEGRLLVSIFDQDHDHELSNAEYALVLNLLFPEEAQPIVQELYGDMRAEAGNYQTMVKALGDYAFCAWHMAQNGTFHTHSEWYEYVFQQPSWRNGMPPTHVSEVLYVFSTVPKPGAADERVIQAMIDYWSSFAAQGDPNAVAVSTYEQRWPVNDPSSTEPTLFAIRDPPALLKEHNEFYCHAWIDSYYRKL